MDVSVGAGLLIVNAAALLVPAVVDTVRPRFPGVPFRSRLAVNILLLTTLTELITTPVPLIATEVAPDTKLEPVTVTGTFDP